MRFNELMTGARQDVVCKIYGEDLDTLAAYAHKLGDLVNTVEGAKDLYVESVGGLPQIVVRHDRAALARYGLDVEAVNDVVRTAFAGSVADRYSPNVASTLVRKSTESNRPGRRNGCWCQRQQESRSSHCSPACA
jgi:cobalt-zinc-cadmium resistance protein CzcA